MPDDEQKKNVAIHNVDECAAALSKALATRCDGDDELYDAVNDHVLRLIAEFVSYRELWYVHSCSCSVFFCLP